MKRFLRDCMIVSALICFGAIFLAVFFTGVVSFIEWDMSIWSEIDWAKLVRVVIGVGVSASMLGQLFQLDEYIW